MRRTEIILIWLWFAFLAVAFFGSLFFARLWIPGACR